MRWNTPMGEYRDFDGLRLAAWGGAVWARPEGPFMYGEFRLRSTFHDVRSQSRPSAAESWDGSSAGPQPVKTSRSPSQ
jgi:hypothetical protein